METVIKQAIGIDCGADELVVSYGCLTVKGDYFWKGSKSFANTKAGFENLVKWASKESSEDVEVRYVMEATGVYHEKLAYYLSGQGCYVSIVLPNKVHAFSKTTKSKQMDDLQASRAIAEFGCVKQLDEWEPPHPLYAALKRLSREKYQMQRELVIVGNELHAEQRRAISSASSIKRMKLRSRLLRNQIIEVEKEIVVLTKSDDEVREKLRKVCTIPGVGLQTAVTVVAETNGFNLVRNARQLVSYAGLDVVQKISGTSVRGKAHISKKGNAHLRRCFYFPAFTAVKYNLPLQTFYNRVMMKTEVKMKGYVGVQRKLLILIYTLWKNDETYNHKLLEQPMEAALTELD